MRKHEYVLIALVILSLFVSAALTFKVDRANVQEMGTTHFTNLECEDMAVTDDLTVTDDSTLSGDLVVTGSTSGVAASFTGSDTTGLYQIYTEQTAISVTAAGGITSTGTYQPIESGAAVTTSTTCAIISGTVNGQILILVNENASDAIIVKDGANTNLAGDITLGNDDSLTMIWDGLDWVAISTSNN